MRIAALFDLDRTILAPPSSERAFFSYLWSQRQVRPSAAWYAALGAIRRLHRGPIAATKGNKLMWRGWCREELAAAAQSCFAEVLAARIYPQMRTRIQEHRSQGHWIVLLSGTLDLLLEPFGEELEADLSVATQLQTDVDGRLSGRSLGVHPYGAGKRVILAKITHEHGLDLARSWAYADDASDCALLSAVGFPVAVNPSPELSAIACRQQWTVLRFEL